MGLGVHAAQTNCHSNGQRMVEIKSPMSRAASFAPSRLSRHSHASNASDEVSESSVWTTLAVGVGLLLVVLVVASVVMDAKAPEQVERSLQVACAGAEHDTIFLGIVGSGRPAITAAAMHSALESARCPFRVRIFLYEPYASESGAARGVPAPKPLGSKALEKFAQKSTRLSAPLLNHIRVVAGDACDGGPFFARHTLLQLAKEPFVAVCPDDLLFKEAWDQLLVDALRKAEALYGDPMLVCPPTAGEFGAFTYVADNRVHFRDFVQGAQVPQPTLAWSSRALTFSRCKQSFFEEPLRNLWDGGHEDVWLSRKCPKLLAPTFAVCDRQPMAGVKGFWTSVGTGAAYMAAAHKGALAQLPSYEDTAEGVLGCTGDNTVEAASKFGSTAHFHYELEHTRHNMDEARRRKALAERKRREEAEDKARQDRVAARRRDKVSGAGTDSEAESDTGTDTDSDAGTDDGADTDVDADAVAERVAPFNLNGAP